MVSPPPFLVSAVLAALVLSAAWTDACTRSIPNWLTFGGVAAGLIVNVAAGGFAGIMAALGGFAIATGVYAVFYILRAVGGGDLKLMGAVGTIAGPSHWFSIFIGSALLGGLIALGVIIWSGRVGRTLRNLGLIIADLLRFRAPWKRSEEVDVRSGKGAALPHALAIAGATIYYLVAIWVKT